MITQTEVESFLKDFKEKLNIWGVFFLARDKNLQTLADLEITPIKREETLKELVWQDYSEGPKPDAAYQGSEMWVFGKEVKSREVYIKITLGRAGSQVLCISFHLSEHPMQYPFKTT
jgi:hypothetical protein